MNVFDEFEFGFSMEYSLYNDKILKSSRFF